MNKLPPTPPTPPVSSASSPGGFASGGDSMRIGPFWKRAIDSAPSAFSPAGDEPFDALTDLFLGEVTGSRLSAAPRSAPRPEPARTPAPSRPAPQSSPTMKAPEGPVLRLAGGDDDDEYRLEPAPAIALAPVAAPSQAEIQTRPAAPVLTLDDDAGEATPVMGVLPPPVRHPVMELLVLGNLPVLAGAWAGQYVREIAEAVGKPVAYLRVQGEFASLELVGALADVAAAPRSQDLDSIDSAIDAAAELTDRWIIRCDSGLESPIIASPITRAVTVLTGADQAAREACKRTLAALAPHLPAADSGPMVRMAIMGAAGASASAAAPELAALASSALSRSVPAIACAGKIGGVRPPHTLFSGPIEHTLESVLHSVQRALIAEPLGVPRASSPVASRPVAETASLPAPPTAPVISPAVASAPTEAAIPTPEAHAVAQQPITPAPIITSTFDAAAAPLPLPSIIAPPVVPTPAAPAAELPAERPSAPASPPVAPATKATSEIRAASIPQAEIADSLASHLTDLTSTAIRCPYASGIEIAIDSLGALHLLARSSSERNDDAAIASLLVASSWTEAHAPLLAPSLGARPLPTRPTLHLFTDRPKATRRLLDTTVRVHLLAEVAVGEEHAWYCTDLN